MAISGIQGINRKKKSMEKKKDKEKDGSLRGLGALGGIFSGLTELVERLGELAEKGEELSKTGNIDLKGSQGKDLKAVYGLSVKTGLGGKGVEVEPFGNVRQDRATGEPVVQEMHEPLVDVFEEDDHVLVLAEMPGVDAEDVQVNLDDDILTLSAVGEDRKYRKEVLLPGSFQPDKMTVSCRNGIVRIKCMKGNVSEDRVH
jgi:HSP20 family protein